MDKNIQEQLLAADGLSDPSENGSQVSTDSGPSSTWEKKVLTGEERAKAIEENFQLP